MVTPEDLRAARFYAAHPPESVVVIAVGRIRNGIARIVALRARAAEPAGAESIERTPRTWRAVVRLER